MYLIVVLLQLISVIHAIRKGKIMPWIYIIIFLPGIGSLAYFIIEILPELKYQLFGFNSNFSLDKLFKSQPNIKELKEELEFKDTVSNREALADAYFQTGNFKDAISWYQNCLVILKDDIYLRKKLAIAYFFKADYQRAKEEFEKNKQAEGGKLMQDELLYYTQCLENLNELKEASLNYQQLILDYPGLEADYRYLNFLTKMGKKKEIVEHLKIVPRKFQALLRPYKGQENKWLNKIKNEFNL